MKAYLLIISVFLTMAATILIYSCASWRVGVSEVVTSPPEDLKPTTENDNFNVEFAFIVRIDRLVNVSLETIDGKEDDAVANIKDSVQLSNVLSKLPKSAKNRKNTAPSNLLLKADNTLNYDQVLKVIESVERVSDLPIWLQISDELVVFIQSQKLGEVPMGNPKPNVFYLQVTVDSQRNLAINGEKHNDLSDTTSLGDRLTELFKGREEAGVFREGSNEIEKTVYITAARSLSFNDVIVIAKVVADSGANPIGLLTYDLEESNETISRPFKNNS